MSVLHTAQRRHTGRGSGWLLIAVTAAIPIQAEVVRIEIKSTEDFAAGHEFDAAGPYRKLTGTLHFEVDPEHPANRRIVDLKLAPRNASGKVVFSAEFFLLTPADAARGNGRLIYDVNNRGNKLLLHAMNGARSNNPATLADAGTGFLMRRGYTVLWTGWNGDVTPGADRLTIELPVARGPDGNITGRVYSEICVDRPARSAPLCPGDSRVYPAADPDGADAALSVREHRLAEAAVVPRGEWSFAREENGRPVPDSTHLFLEGGFRPGWLYELVYTARDPRVSGLGFAAVRDAVSFFRYASGRKGPAGNPLGGAVRHAYGFGISQSGRFLQDLVYQDFNADEQGRVVFDGCYVHVAAAGRTLVNECFAQITRHGSQHEDNLYPTDTFPFTTAPQEDPLTGARGDWLARSRASGHLPKMVLTQTSTEYFGRGGSLLHTDVNGTTDVPLDPAVRLYHIAGGHHLFSTPAEKGIAAHAPNSLDYTPLMRALLVCLDEWVSEGREPPPSAYPRISARTLVPLERYQVTFPAIPGVRVPGRIYAPLRLNLGPGYASAGLVEFAPPRVGPAYRVLVPAVDEDGNEIAGVRLAPVAVPLATYVGWNMRAEPFGVPQALMRWVGSVFPLPAGPEDALRTGDPRRTIVERYAGSEDYVEQVRLACDALVARRLLLDEDVPHVLDQAAAACPQR